MHRSGYIERRQEMVPDIVSELMQAMDVDKDGVVNLCDFMAWSRLHSVGAFVEDYCRFLCALVCVCVCRFACVRVRRSGKESMQNCPCVYRHNANMHAYIAVSASRARRRR